MSRFDIAHDDDRLLRVSAGRLFRLSGPRWVFALAGLVALWGAVSLGLMLAAPNSLIDSQVSAAFGVGVAALLLSPLAQDGINHLGVAVRGALAFFSAGLLAPVATLIEAWRNSALVTPARLAGMISEAAPTLAISAGAHAVLGALAAALIVMAVAQKD